MKSFYIFLDIDGVLYDWDFIINEVESGRMQRGCFIKTFKPESMYALNYLIQELSKNFDVKLVISSTWRSNLPFTIDTLKNNGLVYNSPSHFPLLLNKRISSPLLYWTCMWFAIVACPRLQCFDAPK